ncbi:MAG: rhomboid family intramembrane serine protease [Phycisphaerae bacterium]|nr:rhomboid family intramembrane serine protease [Phycisphaerae bacterium]
MSDPGETTPPKAAYHADRTPWLTWLICALFLALYLLPIVLNRPRLQAAIVDWVTPEVHQISPHNVAALVASAFVHEPNWLRPGDPLWLRLVAAHWHIAFDLGWMWVLGRRAERAIGPVRFAVLFVLAAAVTSCAELIVRANPGVGGSGVRYAIFGFLYVARGVFDRPRRVCNNWLAATFLIWTVVSALESLAFRWDLGMGSHAVGLLLGALLGGAMYVSRRRWLHLAAAVVLIIAVMVTAFQ